MAIGPIFMLALRYPQHHKKRLVLTKLGVIMILAYVKITCMIKTKLPKLINYRRDINSFSEMDCWNYFETKREDLFRLKTALRIPIYITFGNGARMYGEEVLLRGLCELVSGSDQYVIAEEIFGRDQTAQSRAFSWFINYIYVTFYDLVTNNLQWWFDKGFLHRSMEAIKLKIGGNETFSTCAFIDCNALECTRPGGGPISEGPDSERWDPLIQKSFYNGWKCIHGLKHQTVDCAFGITIDIHGPWSLRRNDLHLLRESQINSRFRDIQNGNPFQLTMYGDSIYPKLSHLKSSWRNDANLDWMKNENKAYSKVRINIEWNYMVTSSIYRYLCNSHKLKILGSVNTTRVYIVATILRNCHVALYGSITSNYFNLVIPDNFLEEYLRFNE
jgi:hypothetical protein